MNNKDIIQDEIVKKLIDNEKALLLLPTGVGKTVICIKYLKQIEFNNALIVVSIAKLRDITWIEEFNKWNSSHLLDKITIICYDSLHKYYDLNFDIVIFDEIHSVTENHLNFYKKEFKQVIGLTATEPKDLIKKHIIYNVLNLNIVARMSIDKAIELKLISPYIITKIEVELNNNIKNIEAGNKKNRFLTTEKANYDYLTKVIGQYSNSFSNKEKEMWEIMIRKRYHFMNNLPSKVKVAKGILSELEGQRNLIFSKSIESAKKLSPFVYHSKSTDEYLMKFISGEIDTLSVVNALNEGVNLPNMDNIIIVQLNSSDLVFTQQLGRLIRWRKGFIGNVYIIVVRNTVDENWFLSATKEVTINSVIRL
jgi:superfamily II DNA or RNA helicase